MYEVLLKQACVLLALLIALPMGGQAVRENMYTLPEIKEQAQSGWHRSYEAHGRTIIVDIPIIVPEAKRVSALRISSAHPANDVPVWGQEEQDSVLLDGTEVTNYPFFFDWRSPDSGVLNALFRENPSLKHVGAISAYKTLHEIGWDIAYSVNCPATVRDLDQIQRGVLRRYFPECADSMSPFFVEFQTGAQPFDIISMEYYGEEIDYWEGGLTVHFSQELLGIPFLNAISRISRNGQIFRTDLPFYYGAPGSLYMYSKDSLWYVEQTESSHIRLSLARVDSVIEDDLPLLGIDRIMAAYEKLIDKGQIRRIDSMRLGYLGWYNRDDKTTLTLLPVWEVKGVLMKDAKKNPGVDYPSVGDPEYADIIINAQTGELVDPWDDYPNRVYEVPEIVRWK